VNFVADLEDIGDRVGAVQTAYDKAHNKLVSGRGSLVSRAEAMRELGAKVSKTLPQNLVEMPSRPAVKRVD
jgi:DNA recombination protein RmuC